MKPRVLPPLKYLRECFIYDEYSGKLFWKKRPRRHFLTENAFAVWNSRCAGKEALYVASDGYGVVRLDGINRKVHRIAWKLKTEKEPPVTIDHEDHDKINNRWTNIRAATHAQNNFHKTLRITGKSGIRGIAKRGNNWVAMVSTDEVGIFPTKQEAVSARQNELVKRYGAFAS